MCTAVENRTLFIEVLPVGVKRLHLRLPVSPIHWTGPNGSILRQTGVRVSDVSPTRRVEGVTEGCVPFLSLPVGTSTAPLFPRMPGRVRPDTSAPPTLL